MNRFAFSLSLLALCLLAAPSRADDAAFAEEASKRLNEAFDAESCGLAVLIARDGKIVFEGAYGLADVENKTPITTETKFRIGSVSKQFTAAAILKLAEEGKLALDDPLTKFYPDYPHAEGVTIEQLLTHTSGLHSYTDKPDFKGRVTSAIEPAKLIEYFQNDDPDFAPTTNFHYNNSGYFLLGEIVGKVSGKPLAEYLKETFFDPLEMKSTGVFVNASAPEGAAKGYSWIDDKLSPAVDWDMSWAGGAGALYSTVGDLFRWNEALYSGKVLKEDTLKAATTPVKLPEGVDGMNYGYGLTMLEVSRLPAVAHGGGLDGWSSYLVRIPGQNCTVVALANSLPSPPKIAPAPIAHALATKLLAAEIAALPPVAEDSSVDPKTFADFVGRYDYQSAVMTVSVEGDSLFAQLTGQPKSQIFPKAKDAFFWKIVDAEVLFVRDDEGKVIAARHTQGGNSFKAAKIDDETVKLSAEDLGPLIGKYQYGLAATLTVTADGVQLFGQLTGQPKFPIFPVAKDEFQWKVVDAKVKFVKDDDGKVTKAVHSQGGVTFDAPRIAD